MARSGSYDVAVVGAGVIGLAIAWRARRSGLATVVVERDRAGAAASGIAAGMLAPVTEADFGDEALVALNLAGRARWPAFAAELSERSGIDVGYRESGALVVGADRDDAAELRRLAELHRSLGLDSRWLSGRECRRLEPGLSPRVAGGIETPHEAHVDPASVLEALHACFVADGGEVVEGVAVRELRLAGEATRVEGLALADGRVMAAREVVVAAGPWSSQLVSPEGDGEPILDAPPVRPLKGQILTLRGPTDGEPLAHRLVRTPRCYVVPRGDGRVVVGATSEERGFDTRVTAEGVFRLLEAAREVLPALDELELVSARAGLRPVTRDNAPAIGRSAPDGLVWATGHGRHGVLLAPITAEAVVALLRGADPPEPGGAFSPERFAVAGDRAPRRRAAPKSVATDRPADRRGAAAPATRG